MDPASARERMVARLEQAGRIERPETAAAMRAVPRHLFVPNQPPSVAYRDQPLRIGSQQTISAPHMVARMTDLLAPEPGDRVLEIGTGCGYHAAVTANAVGENGRVVSLEYHDQLAEKARERLATLDVPVTVHTGDGHGGWPPEAPYDAAYLTCAAPAVPDAITRQVPDGPIVAPVGRRHQELVRIRRTPDGPVRESHGSVRFVPMLGNDS